MLLASRLPLPLTLPCLHPAGCESWLLVGSPLAVLYSAMLHPACSSIKTNHPTINSWDFKIAEIITHVAFELNEGILDNIYLTLLLIKNCSF